MEINAEAMGGRHVLRDRALLESAVARPQASAFGVDAYPVLASKAAALLQSLVLNHAFVDGNKRTAVLATLVFLDLNGYVVRWDQNEALDFVLRLAVDRIQLDDAVTFLRARMHPKDIATAHPKGRCPFLTCACQPHPFENRASHVALTHSRRVVFVNRKQARNPSVLGTQVCATISFLMIDRSAPASDAHARPQAPSTHIPPLPSQYSSNSDHSSSPITSSSE